MSNTNNANKVAIVTGSSRGIGASIAKRLAADGFTIIVNYAGRETDANQVVEEIKVKGGRATAIQADVAVFAQVAAMAAGSMARHCASMAAWSKRAIMIEKRRFINAFEY
jgi:NAD(P)-dependent dehydrogenase (short-subunit alcohol dehydrogenase family)